MLIDVIIPTFNRAAFLEKAIESVLNQSYQNFNLYVIDDGSSDETPQLLAKYADHKKIHLFRQENLGVSAARNLGINKSKAQWISFLDSDDEWLKHKLQSQVEFSSLRPDCRFIHSNEIWVRNGVRVNPKLKFDKSNHEIFRRSLETCLISPSTVMIKRELLLEHNGFDPSFDLCEDYDLWLKILLYEEIGFIPDYLIRKNGGHADQLSTKYPAMDFWRIRSLVNLLTNHKVPPEKHGMILNEIDKKAEILLKGFIKHQDDVRHAELNALLKIIRV